MRPRRRRSAKARKARRSMCLCRCGCDSAALAAAGSGWRSRCLKRCRGFPQPISCRKAAMVHVARLSLSNFRSYADAVIVPGAGLNVLTGENGAGKTNVLEAVSLLAPGRGLRQATLGEMARSPGPGGFAVAEIGRAHV